MMQSTRSRPEQLAGVIEGFYGPPWSRAERLGLLDQMVQGGLNTYMYAPKDDLNHRALWRQCYDEQQAATIRQLIFDCSHREIRFIYALSPGLDIRFSSSEEMYRLQLRLAQMMELGCKHFALLFDDIPDAMHEDDRQQFGSFAAAQCEITNELLRWVREQLSDAQFAFCPTPYCSRMQRRNLGGADYLQTVGRQLNSEIDVFWTGPEIISREITVDHIRHMQALLRRKPLIWDNLHANDYDGRRIYCGPYAGRPLALRGEVAGIMHNPNCEFPLNFVPWQTFSDYWHAGSQWDERKSYLQALESWLPRFRSTSGTIGLEQLIQLIDCFYLPFEEGPVAQQLHTAARQLTAAPSQLWPERGAQFAALAKPLRNTCAEIANLYDRALFAALSRRTWELREELDLLLACMACKVNDPQAVCRSDYHLPGTYRGGLVPKLQRLLRQNADESFTPIVDATLSADSLTGS
ncbi:MAG: beta-N-acetylglucosaminidase domain-containing protein [Pirellulaceae bacterium]|nr:beta-N-acetylglucosaminidase domain-containing protein [Pirellulaceae bacterium]